MTSSARSKTPWTSSAGREGCFSEPTMVKGYTTPDPGSSRARRRRKRLRRKRLAGNRADELDDEACRLPLLTPEPSDAGREPRSSMRGAREHERERWKSPWVLISFREARHGRAKTNRPPFHHKRRGAGPVPRVGFSIKAAGTGDDPPMTSDRRPHVLIVGRRFRRARGGERPRRRPRPRHGRRPAEPLPLPASALPGRHRGPLAGGHRLPHSLDPPPPEKRRRRARRGRRHRPRPAARSRCGTARRSPTTPSSWRRAPATRTSATRTGRRALRASRTWKTRSRSAAVSCSPSRRPTARRARSADRRS